MTVRPRYPEVFDICGDRAAVRFGNNRAGVVNETGQPGIQLDRCRKMKFMKGDLLAVTDCAGNESYIDLKVNRTYREKPVVLSFGHAVPGEIPATGGAWAEEVGRQGVLYADRQCGSVPHLRSACPEP